MCENNRSRTFERSEQIVSPGVSYTFRFNPVWSRFGLIAGRKSVCRVPRRIAEKVAVNSNVRVKRNKSRDVGQHENHDVSRSPA